MAELPIKFTPDSEAVRAELERIQQEAARGTTMPITPAPQAGRAPTFATPGPTGSPGPVLNASMGPSAFGIGGPGGGEQAARRFEASLDRMSRSIEALASRLERASTGAGSPGRATREQVASGVVDMPDRQENLGPPLIRRRNERGQFTQEFEPPPTVAVREGGRFTGQRGFDPAMFGGVQGAPYPNRRTGRWEFPSEVAPELPNLRPAEAGPANMLGGELGAALGLAQLEGRTSVSRIQQRMGVGYGKAQELMGALQKRGLLEGLNVSEAGRNVTVADVVRRPGPDEAPPGMVLHPQYESAPGANTGRRKAWEGTYKPGPDIVNDSISNVATAAPKNRQEDPVSLRAKIDELQGIQAGLVASGQKPNPIIAQFLGPLQQRLAALQTAAPTASGGTIGGPNLSHPAMANMAGLVQAMQQQQAAQGLAGWPAGAGMWGQLVPGGPGGGGAPPGAGGGGPGWLSQLAGAITAPPGTRGGGPAGAPRPGQPGFWPSVLGRQLRIPGMDQNMPMGLYFMATFGLMEVGHAGSASAIAQAMSGMGESQLEKEHAEMQGRVAQAAGPMGSLINMGQQIGNLGIDALDWVTGSTTPAEDRFQSSAMVQVRYAQHALAERQQQRVQGALRARGEVEFSTAQFARRGAQAERSQFLHQQDLEERQLRDSMQPNLNSEDPVVRNTAWRAFQQFQGAQREQAFAFHERQRADIDMTRRLMGMDRPAMLAGMEGNFGIMGRRSDEAQARAEAAKTGYEHPELAAAANARANDQVAVMRERDRQEQRDLRVETRSSELRLERNFDESQRVDLRQQEREAMRSVRTYGGQQEVKKLFRSRQAELEMGFVDRDTTIRVGQETSGRQIEALLDRNRVGAQAIGEAGAARAQALEFQQHGMTEFKNEALNQGVAQLQLTRQNYLDAFRGERFEANRIAVNNPRDTENPTAVLNSIQQEIAGLRADLAGMITR